jgi:hypothetical protein
MNREEKIRDSLKKASYQYENLVNNLIRKIEEKKVLQNPDRFKLYYEQTDLPEQFGYFTAQALSEYFGREVNFEVIKDDYNPDSSALIFSDTSIKARMEKMQTVLETSLDKTKNHIQVVLKDLMLAIDKAQSQGKHEVTPGFLIPTNIQDTLVNVLGNYYKIPVSLARNPKSPQSVTIVLGTLALKRDADDNFRTTWSPYGK